MTTFYVEDREHNLVEAKFLTDANGNPIVSANPTASSYTLYTDLSRTSTVSNPNGYMIVPADHDISADLAFALTVKAALNTPGPILTSGTVGLGAALGMMTGAYIPGGALDYQRTYNGLSNATSVPAFRDSSSYLLGYVTAKSGLPLFMTEIGGGGVNIYAYFQLSPAGRRALNMSGSYWLASDNQASIEAGAVAGGASVSGGIVEGSSGGMTVFSDGAGSASFARGNGFSFYADSTGLQFVAGTNFSTGKLGDGGTLSIYTDPLTGENITLSVDANGAFTLGYTDSSGDWQIQDFSSPLDLSSEQLDKYNALQDASLAALTEGIDEYWTDAGDPSTQSTAVYQTIDLWRDIAPDVDVDGETYNFADIADNINAAGAAIGQFISDQAAQFSEWFTGPNGANLIFANWLASNMEDLVNGDLDPEDAFISLAESVGSQYVSYDISRYLDRAGGNTFTAAHYYLSDVLHDAFGIDNKTQVGWLTENGQYVLDANGAKIPLTAADQLSSSMSGALASFAVNALFHSGTWNTQQYVNAGIMTLTTLVTQNAASSFFENSAVDVDATVAAVTTVVATLLSDSSLNTEEWVQLGVNVGVAVAASMAGDAIAIALNASPGGPVAVIATAVIITIASQFTGNLFGHETFGPGEYPTKAMALKSIYAVQQIDDGNGNMVSALVATNPQGSAVILKSGISYALGGAGADTVIGDGGGVMSDDILSGGAGSDFIDGKKGDDNLLGGDGNDHIIGGEGADLLSGDAGNDELFGDAGDDTILGGTGDDFAHAGSGDDIVAGGDGQNILLGSGGADLVQAGSGDDFIEAGDGDDLVQAGAGNDIILGNLGNDNIDGEDGNDIIFGEMDNDQLSGGGGDDYLDGGDGIDLLSGENGKDLLVGGLGDDFLDGGLGDDSLDGGIGDDVILGGLDNDLLIGDDGNDTLTGDQGDDILNGGDGNDSLDGGAGDDKYYFAVPAGHDTITDSAGSDTIVLDGISSGDIAFAEDGDDLVITYGANNDTIRVVGQLLAPVVETLELSDGKVDLTALTFPGGVADYTVDTLVSPALTGILAKMSDLQDTEDAKNLELTNNKLMSIIGLQTYGEAVKNEVVNTYYNGSEIVHFQRSRGGLFGGDYTVYKVRKLSNLEGGTQVFSYTELKPGDVTTQYDDIINATKVTYVNKSKTIEDIWIDGQVVATTIISANGKRQEAEAGASFADNYLNNGALVTKEDRYTKGSLQAVSMGELEVKTGLDQLVGSYWNEKINGNGGDDYLFGGGGDDTINGGNGNDWLFGADGNDTITGGEGNDLILGGVGNDVVDAGNGNDAIILGDGNDTLSAGAGDDWIDGGAGNDTIDGGAGNDQINGGDGSDTIVYTSSSAAVSVSLVTGTSTGSGTDTFLNIENITGSNYGDTLTGDDGANILNGGLGTDTLIGGEGDDTYVVDNSGDVVTENSSEGTDLVQSIALNYTLGSNVENLTLLDAGGANNAFGNGLDNVITGNIYSNTLSGGAGNDTIADGGISADVMIGGAGNDTYVVAVSSDVISENSAEGTDLVQSSVAYTLAANVENLTMTVSSVTGTGNTMDNILSAVTGGVNTLAGGAGNDTYIIDSNDVVVEAASSGTDTVQVAATYTLGSEVENLILTGTSAISGTGNTLNNVITGNGAANTLSGAAGVDTLIGGAGDDTYLVDSITDTITENGGGGTDTISSSVSFDMSSIANVENLILTGATTNGTGNSLDNVITVTGTGVNILSGGAGNDTLDGGSGADTMIGGTGNDTFYIGTAGEVITENLNEGADTVYSTVTYTLAANVENLVLTGSSTIHGTGNSLDNILTGNSVKNTLTGGAGNDTYIISGTDVVVEAVGEGRYYSFPDESVGARSRSRWRDDAVAFRSFRLHGCRSK